MRGWGLAVPLSLALHAGLGVLVLALLDPPPVEPVSTKEKRFEVQSLEVDASRAAAATPNAERQTGQAGTAEAVFSGEVPTSRQTPLRLDGEATQPIAPGSERVPNASPNRGAILAMASESQRLTAARHQTSASKAIEPRAEGQSPSPYAAVAQAIPVAAPAGRMLAAQGAVQSFLAARIPAATGSDPVQRTTPDRSDIPAVTGSSETIAASYAKAMSALPAPPEPRRAPPVEPDGFRTSAFGAGLSLNLGDPVDTVSLAAIQSFLVPNRADGQNARDGIAALFGGEPCARLQAEFIPETGAIELRGHIPDPARRAPLLGDLTSYLGGSISVSDNIKILPRPQCDMLNGVAALGLPQSTDQRTDPSLVGTDAHTRSYTYSEGDRLVLDVAAADYSAWIYVDFFDAQGQVVHLVPNEQVAPLLLETGESDKIGGSAADDRFLDLVVAPPFGQELAVAYAASHELYKTPRPLREPAGPYLVWLRERIAETRAQNPGFKGEWVYFHVETSP